MFKKLFVILMLAFLCVVPVSAEEKESCYREEFIFEGNFYVYEMIDGVGTVTIRDPADMEVIKTIIYDSNDNCLYINGERQENNIVVVENLPAVIEGNELLDVIKSYNYSSDINITVGDLSGAVDVIATIIMSMAIIASAQLSSSNIWTGVSYLWTILVNIHENLANTVLVSARVAFTQQINQTTNQFRNINRLLKLKLITDSTYRTYTYSNTGWQNGAIY